VNIEEIEAALKNEDAAPPDLAKVRHRPCRLLLLLRANAQADTDQKTSGLAAYSNLCRLEKLMIRSMEEIRRTQTKTEMVWNTTEDGQAEVALE
jgi:hypothetical protein